MARKNNKVSIQARRRLFISSPLCLFFVFLLVITFGYNMVEYHNVIKEKEAKEEEYNKLQDESEYLKKEIIKLNDPDYLANFAREHYSYSKEGEIILQIEEEKTEEVKVTTNSKEYNMPVIMVGIVAGVLLIIYIIIKVIKRKKI